DARPAPRRPHRPGHRCRSAGCHRRGDRPAARCAGRVGAGARVVAARRRAALGCGPRRPRSAGGRDPQCRWPGRARLRRPERPPGTGGAGRCRPGGFRPSGRPGRQPRPVQRPGPRAADRRGGRPQLRGQHPGRAAARAGLRRPARRAARRPHRGLHLRSVPRSHAGRAPLHRVQGRPARADAQPGRAPDAPRDHRQLRRPGPERHRVRRRRHPRGRGRAQPRWALGQPGRRREAGGVAGERRCRLGHGPDRRLRRRLVLPRL
ncbi:MAG: 3-oxoacyl-[acyl-carrier protein] reductase, partial [uncultured Quadrisphaera sp.]